MTEQEIIQANVAKWRKEQEARKSKAVSKKKAKKQFKNKKRDKTLVQKHGVAFDAIREALEEAIEEAGK